MNEQVKPCSRFRRLNGTIDNQWGGCEASQIFQVGIQDIDGETGRNANGDMVRDRITTKRKLDCEWGMMTQGEISQLYMLYHLNFF